MTVASPTRAGVGGRWGQCAFAFAVTTVLLVGCATAPPALTSVKGQTYAGRLVLRIDASDSGPARAVTAAFELRGDAERGGLDLSTPLGSVLAQARWAPGEVSLNTPGRVDRFVDLDALTQTVLGESVPVVALFDWLQGAPWRGAPSAPLLASVSTESGPSGTANPDARGFRQLGWAVDFGRFAEASSLVAKRETEPAVTLRIQLERP